MRDSQIAVVCFVPTFRAYKIPEFARAHRISISQTYKEIAAGRLGAVKVGRRTLIAVTEAERWLNALPVSTGK